LTQRIDCSSVGHTFGELYSFAVKRGRSLIVFQQCEMCGLAQVVELCRGKGRRRVIVDTKDTEFYKQLKEKTD